MDSNKLKPETGGKKELPPKAPSLLSKAAPFAIGATALLIIAVVFSVFMLPKTPSAGGAGLEEAADFSPSLKDSAAYKALAESGLENAIVESKENEVLVYLQVDAGRDEREAAFTALGAAGALAKAESTIKVQVEQGGRKTFYSASAAYVHALLDGKISDEEFESRVSSN